MKKLFSLIIATICCISLYAQDFGQGMTFYKGSEILDFYNNGMVVYYSQGSPVSRRGDWQKGGGRGVVSRGSNRRVSNGGITVQIYVDERTVVFKGDVNYANGQISSVTLNGETWYRK